MNGLTVEDKDRVTVRYTFAIDAWTVFDKHGRPVKSFRRGILAHATLMTEFKGGCGGIYSGCASGHLVPIEWANTLPEQQKKLTFNNNEGGFFVDGQEVTKAEFVVLEENARARVVLK